MSALLQAALFGDENKLRRVYADGREQRIAELCRLHPAPVTTANLSAQLPELAGVEAIFATWGMPVLTPEQLDRLPRLKAVFYAAGSVKNFAGPLLERGIIVVNAAAANAVPVAEFTLAQILLANKGYFRNIRDAADPRTRKGAFAGAGNFEETVALLGAGMVGRKVIELLKISRLKILVYDPFLSPEAAARLGVELVTLEEAFARGLAVSNHLANVPETRGLLQARHFQAMRENAVFINTGRGATVVEADLVAVLRRRTDLTALLDVTYPEPPLPDSPLYAIPNILLSSHLAGAIGQEVVTMADTVIEEFLAWRDGKPLRYAVTLKMLATMA